ncbi:MAG: acyl-CoA thioester hydrolase/BAAT C-terminal domain-containing protein [Tissierellia bacterium]|nr:acyl-CoA thioester hydrolase/BAAT C-terminal domain-containing protein [Tissierellia bacterium]
MQKTKKILIRSVIISLVIFLIIFAVRLYNDKKYKDLETTSSPKYYEDVTNLDLYPSEIEGVDITYVDYKSMQGFRLLPKNKLHKGVVVTFGGSEGSPNFEEARRLAEKGYETYALFMFGMKNQAKTLTKIPLEQFEDLKKYLEMNVEDRKPLTLLGASKGAEYALNLASKYKDIDNLILFAPASYNFSGLDFQDYGSSWTYRGEELAYIDIQKGSFSVFLNNIVLASIINSPIAYENTYKSAIDKDDNNYEKLIPVKEIEADILMFAGEEDSMWNSLEMANIIRSQNSKAKVYPFEGAGHIFGLNSILNSGNMKIKLGGNLEDNKRAKEESDRIVDDFLSNKHK